MRKIDTADLSRSVLADTEMFTWSVMQNGVEGPLDGGELEHSSLLPRLVLRPDHEELLPLAQGQAVDEPGHVREVGVAVGQDHGARATSQEPLPRVTHLKHVILLATCFYY